MLSRFFGRSRTRRGLEALEGGMIAMAAGKVYSSGPASEVMTTTMVREVFGLDSHVFADPVSGRPMMVPLGRHERRPPSPASTIQKEARSTVPDTEASSS